MSEKSIESRRAFFKKAGKALGAAALAAPFLAAAAQDAMANQEVERPSGDAPRTCNGCSGGCKGGCNGCSGACGNTCRHGK